MVILNRYAYVCVKDHHKLYYFFVLSELGLWYIVIIYKFAPCIREKNGWIGAYRPGQLMSHDQANEFFKPFKLLA